MISDERLREAARKAEESLLASLPEPEECEATFSPEFERKMEKLIHRAKHPIRHRILKAVACFLLVILVGGGSVLTFSMEARAAFVGWVREVYDTWFVYRYNGTTQDTSQNTIYQPTWIPDGYEEKHRSEHSSRMSIVYQNAVGDMLVFSYSSDPASMSLYVDHEFKVVKQVEIGNNYADLYMDQREGAANEIVWTDSETGTIFLISAPLPDTELLKISESITAIPNDE